MISPRGTNECVFASKIPTTLFQHRTTTNNLAKYSRQRSRTTIPNCFTRRILCDESGDRCRFAGYNSADSTHARSRKISPVLPKPLSPFTSAPGIRRFCYSVPTAIISRSSQHFSRPRSLPSQPAIWSVFKMTTEKATKGKTLRGHSKLSPARVTVCSETGHTTPRTGWLNQSPNDSC